MRTFVAMIIAGFLMAGPAYAQSQPALDHSAVAAVNQTDNALAALAQDTADKPKKKIQLRRVCTKDLIRCACADTGTSACCTASQTCNCQPTANCRTPK